jgi:hypothetical protein
MPAAAPLTTTKINIVQNRVIPKTLITGSITSGRSDQTIRGTNPLPKAVPVPANLMASAPSQKLKAIPKITIVSEPSPQQASTRKMAKLYPATKHQTTAPEAKTVTRVIVKANVSATSQPLSGWTVQLSSQRQSVAAWDVWKNLSVRHKAILKGQQATVIKANLGTRGIYYRLRVHKLESKKQAASLCRKLKKAGTSCFISKA